MFDCEIISADSRQIYKGLESGSGAPSEDELRQVRHHLISVVDPDVRVSAGEYARLARAAIEDVVERQKHPLVVGGSGLYVRALIDGLAPIPEPDKNLRHEINSEIDQFGMEEMILRLSKIDPEYADKVGLNDRKRLVRALEVFRQTGQTLTEWHSSDESETPWMPQFFGLSRPRGELHDMIRTRVHSMISSGWMDELEKLISRYGGVEYLPSSVSETLGYRELVEIREQKANPRDVLERIIISTRQFAKRQMTWFRADSRVEWDEQSGTGAVEKWTEWIASQLEGAYSAKLT